MKIPDTEHLKTLQELDWTKVKYFYYVAKLGSFTNAARFLNSTQPGLSRQISLLEKDLNCTLFYRGARGVILTRKGEELFKVMERCFLDMKSFNFNHITMSDDGQKRKIRVSTTHAVAAYIIGKHILEYNQLNPHILFEIVHEDSLIDLTINDIDISIRPYDEEATYVEQEYLFTLTKNLYASENYIKQYGEPQSIDEMINHRVITHSQPERYKYSDLNWILKLGMNKDKIREPVYMTSSLENGIEAAFLGLGIIASYNNMSVIKDSKLKIILPNVTSSPVEWCFTYPQHLKDDNETLLLKEYLLKKLSK